MRPQRLDRVVLSGELGLCQQRMYLAMANAMQEFSVCTASGFGHQMMRIFQRVRYRSIAQRTEQRIRLLRADRRQMLIQQLASDTATHQRLPVVMMTTITME